MGDCTESIEVIFHLHLSLILHVAQLDRPKSTRLGIGQPKNPPKKNPPKKNVKQRFVDGKLEPFPKRGKPKQNIRKAADSGPAPSNVKSCAKTIAEYKHKKDIDYKKYLKEKGKAR